LKPLHPKRRLLWVAPSPDMQSSFSVVSQNLLERLNGWETVYAAQFHYGQIEKRSRFYLAPFHSGDHLIHYVNVFKPDVTLIFQSPAFLTNLTSTLKTIKPHTRLMLYSPIEGYPITLDLTFFELADKIIVPSRYSQETLAKHGFKSEVLPHAVDTNIFKPQPKPEVFTVGSVASHTWRKQLDRIIDAHKICLEKTHDIRLLLYTSTYDTAAWMPNIKRYAEIVNPNAYFNVPALLNLPATQEAIAKIYNQMHVHILTSTEAFGIPNLEAMASGVVPIIIPHGASPEIVGECGIYARISDYLTTCIGKIALVDVQDLADKIIWAKQHPHELQKLAQKGLAKAKQYNWENTTRKLETLLEEA